MGLLDRERSTARSDGLDLLRFGLAMWIVIEHLSFWGGFTATGQATLPAKVEYFNETVLFMHPIGLQPAVLTFIVLSGYCIHRGGARRDRWDVTAYAIRRAFRIVPVFVVASLVGALAFLLAARLNNPVTVEISGTSGISASELLRKLSTLTAVIPISHMEHNRAANAYQGNGPLYTIAAEIWLYLIYGVVMTLMVRRGVRDRTVWTIIVSVTVAGLVLVAVRPDLQLWYLNASVIGFLPLWWIGAACVGIKPRWSIAAAALAVWVGCTLYLQHHSGLLVVEAHTLSLAVLAGVGVRALDGRPVKIPRVAPLRCGYSLYAFHAPLLFVLIALGIPWPLIAVAAVLVGVQMFRLLERPTTRYGRRLAERRLRLGDAVPGALHPGLRPSR